MYCFTHGFYRREGEIKCSPQNTYLPPETINPTHDDGCEGGGTVVAGLYVDGKRVKGICGENARWGIGSYAFGTGSTMYGYPGPDVKASEFKPDWECCQPAELDRWHEALVRERKPVIERRRRRRERGSR